MSKLKPAEQIETLQHLTPLAAAYVVGIHVTTLRDRAHKCPPQSDGTYDIRDLVGHAIEESSTAKSKDEEDQLNRKRRIEADTLQIKLDILRRNVLPTDELKSVTAMMAAMLRSLGERLEKQFGPDACDLLNDQLDEIEKAFNESVVVIDDRSTDLLADFGETIDGDLPAAVARGRKKAKNTKPN